MAAKGGGEGVGREGVSWVVTKHPASSNGGGEMVNN